MHLFGFLIRRYHDACSSKCQEKKKGKSLFTLTTMELLFFGHSTCGLVTIPAMLSWLTPVNKSNLIPHQNSQHMDHSSRLSAWQLGVND